SGTAHGIPGILNLSVAAKTGTAQNAQNNTGLNDAVFTAFAPTANPSIAIGVVIKGGGYGAAAAGPIAVAVIKAYLAPRGRRCGTARTGDSPVPSRPATASRPPPLRSPWSTRPRLSR